MSLQVYLVQTVPKGTICIWHGNIASIPTGWALCNGSNGTPDLRNRFVVCANADVGGIAKSTITGSALQTLNDTVHAHGVDTETSAPLANIQINTVPATNGGVDDNHTHQVSTVTSAASHVPSFYALAYIMKI